MTNQIKIKNNTAKLTLSLRNYPLEAIYGAAYVFLDRAYLFLDSRTSDKVELFLKGKKKMNKKQLETLGGEFLNELFNYTVRVNLAKRNRKIREYIIGQALLSAVGEEHIIQKDEFTYQEDPLGIAIPWEEKYGKKSKSSAKRSTSKK